MKFISGAIASVLTLATAGIAFALRFAKGTALETEFVTDSSLGAVLSLGISMAFAGVISGANFLIRQIMVIFLKLIKPPTFGSMQTIAFGFLSVFYTLNSACIPIIVGMVPFAYTQAWFEQGGCANDGFSVVLLSGLMDAGYVA